MHVEAGSPYSIFWTGVQVNKRVFSHNDGVVISVAYRENSHRCSHLCILCQTREVRKWHAVSFSILENVGIMMLRFPSPCGSSNLPRSDRVSVFVSFTSSSVYLNSHTKWWTDNGVLMLIVAIFVVSYTTYIDQ